MNDVQLDIELECRHVLSGVPAYPPYKDKRPYRDSDADTEHCWRCNEWVRIKHIRRAAGAEPAEVAPRNRRTTGPGGLRPASQNAESAAAGL